MSKRLFILVLVAWKFSLSQAADVFYANPVIPGDHPDPSIIRVGKDYWATATSSEWGPQFPLLHSTDLVNWDLTGAVFPHRPSWAVGNFWAPEISQFKNHYHVYYVGHKNGGPLAVGVAIADNPSGPYTDHGPIIAQSDGSIDPAPCVDEKGAPYLVWKEDGNSIRKPTPIWVQPLNEDGTKLVGQPTELIHNDADWEGGVVEGPFVLRRGDWFYLFYSGNGCCGSGCNYALGVARAHSLLGPWEKYAANPILAANDYWKCPGHGSIVTDEKGRCWLLYHAYSAHGSVFTGREALLDEVIFGPNGWPSINDGRGPSWRTTSPLGVRQKTNELSFRDDFSGPHLDPGWQWPQQDEPRRQLVAGQLIISGQPGPATNALIVLARSTLTADYVATVAVDVTSLRPGVFGGLSAFGDLNNALGLSAGDGKIKLWRREHGKTIILQEIPAPSKNKFFLRLTSTRGYQFHFAVSANVAEWQSIGEDLVGKNLPPWDRSVRVALTVEGSEDARGYFESFQMTPLARTPQ